MVFKKIILFFLVFYSLSDVCQNAINEYKKIIQSQKKTDYLFLNIDVTAYETKDDKTPELVGKGVLKRSKNVSYSKYNEQEMLYGEKFTLIINNETKSIDYYEHEKSKRPKMKNDYFSMIDSTLLEIKDDFKYYGIVDNLKHFSVATPEDMIESTDFYFNSSNNLLSKVVYSYGPSTEDYEAGIAVAVITYKNYSFEKIKINDDKAYYIVKQGNSWIGINSYKGFKVNFYKG